MKILFLGLVGLVLIESWPSAHSHLVSPALQLERVEAASSCGVRRIDSIARHMRARGGEAWGSVVPRTGLRLRLRGGGGFAEGHEMERMCVRGNLMDAIRGGSGHSQGTVHNCGMSYEHQHTKLPPSSPSQSPGLMQHSSMHLRHAAGACI
jgi:hypothetical protein